MMIELLFLLLALFPSNSITAVSNIKLEGCINQGKIENGLVVMTSDEKETIRPHNGMCPKYTVALEPGTILNNGVVNSLGLCINNGLVLAGFASTVSSGLASVGSKLAFSDKKCSSKGDSGVYISSNVALDVLKSSNEIFTVHENPLLGNSSFRTITLRESVCLESGTILNGLLRVSTLSNEIGGKCPQSTSLISKGVLNGLTKQPLSTANQCLLNGVLDAGRVVFGTVVHLNNNLSSDPKLKGVICSITNDDFQTASGVILKPGVRLLVPEKDKARRYRPKVVENGVPSENTIQNNMIKSKDENSNISKSRVNKNKENSSKTAKSNKKSQS